MLSIRLALPFIAIYALVLLASLQAKADKFFVDLNGFYLSDTFKTATTSTSTRMLYDVSVGFGVDKKDHFMIGWNYTGHSLSDAANSVTTTYSTTQMGPVFLFFLGKDRNWRISAAYNLQTSGVYTAGSATAEKWKGTGMGTSFGYQFNLSDELHLGLRYNYSMTTYTESLIGTTYSTVSYNRTLMYPSIAITGEF